MHYNNLIFNVQQTDYTTSTKLVKYQIELLQLVHVESPVRATPIRRSPV